MDHLDPSNGFKLELGQTLQKRRSESNIFKMEVQMFLDATNDSEIEQVLQEIKRKIHTEWTYDNELKPYLPKIFSKLQKNMDATKMNLFVDILLNESVEWFDMVALIEKEPRLFTTLVEDMKLVELLKKVELNYLVRETRQLFFDDIIAKENLSQVLASFQADLSDGDLIDHIKHKDSYGRNALMRAALNASDQVLMNLISYLFFHPQLSPDSELLHDVDNDGKTLLSIVVSQGETLTFAKELLFKIERDMHRGQDNAKDLVPLTQCLISKLGPSGEVAQTLQDEESYLHPNPKLTWFKVMIPFLVQLAIISLDIFTDSILTKKYYYDMVASNANNISESNCRVYNETLCWLTKSSGQDLIEDLVQYPRELKPQPCFWYSLSFLLLPLICYVIEWYFQEADKLKTKVSKTLISNG